MEANARTIRKILHSGDQFLIPFFQRCYSWTGKHWERLRRDVWRLADNGSSDPHFLGPMVCTAIDHVPGTVPAYQLIDGQQRLTTITVLLAAMRDIAKEKGLEKLANKIHEDCLVHRNEEDLQRYKVVPRIGDREALISVIEGKSSKEFKSYNVVQAWRYFRQHVRRFVGKGDAQERMQRLFSVVADQLSLVVISITGENPYEIFESLNSTGLPLEESDLIRNFLFMQVSLQQQQKFHDNSWRPFEKLFEKTDQYPTVKLTQFYRNYLMRNGAYSRANETFVDFKKAYESSGMSPMEMVEELQDFAKLDLYLRRPATCPAPDIAGALEEIELLDVSTAHPLLLHLLDLHEREQISKKELLECFQDLSSFVLRRSICGESTRAYGRVFIDAIKALGDKNLDNLRAYLGNRGWPDDASFCSSLNDFAVYRREHKKSRLMLLKLEKARNPKEEIDKGELTIEHIMPQSIGNDKNGKQWKEDLGPEWKKIHDQQLHTLGNLILTGYNTPLGNKSFDDKRKLLKESNLSLNRTVAKVKKWTSEEIKDRGKELAKAIAGLWTRPVANEYVPPENQGVGQKGKAAYKKRRENYWNDLKQVLSDLKKTPEPLKISDGTSIEFPVGVKDVYLRVWIIRKRSEVAVYMVTNRKHGHAIHAALESEKQHIEKSLGESLDWSDYCITLSRPDSPIIAEDDWYDQHEWLAEKLEDFYKFIIPKVKELDEAGVGKSGKSTKA